MDNYGKTIAQLRKKHGMTQAELGKALNVTYQAVSKWENNLSQPGIDMVSDMCKIFNITVNDFIKMSTNQSEVHEEPAASSATAQSSGLSREETAKVIRQELDRVEENKQKQLREERLRQERLAKIREDEEKRNSAVLTRVFVIISSVIALFLFVCCAISNEWIAGAVVAYITLAFGSQVCRDCTVSDLFLDSWLKSVGMPGVIFGLDLGGILFFLAYKLIIAPLLSLLIGLIIGIGGTLLSIFISIFTFPFAIPGIIRDMRG